jgi:hypothetical protein
MSITRAGCPWERRESTLQRTEIRKLAPQLRI